MNRRACIGIMCAGLLCSVVWAAEPLPSGDKVIDGVCGVLAKMQDLTTDFDVSTGGRQASGSFILQYIQQKDAAGREKIVSRHIEVWRATSDRGPMTIKQVNDGTYLWMEKTLVETGESKVVRRRVDPEHPVPGGFGIDLRRDSGDLRKKFTFRMLRADTVDDEPVIVVEAKGKPVDENAKADAPVKLPAPERMLLFVSTRDSFPRKVEIYSTHDAAGKEVEERLAVSVKFMHVKLNKGLAPDTFQYQPPPGAELTDVK